MLNSVKDRYSKGAQQQEAALCCPVSYNQEYLKIIPAEVIEKDYGCGDPSQYVKPGDTVLDLGSGGGKICFIAAQVAGKEGKIIGVDGNQDMLALARKHAPTVADAMGYHNLDFRYGYIQDLQLNLAKVSEYLTQHPIKTMADYEKLEKEKDRLRHEEPLIPDNSIDLVVSNCVLNLVSDSEKQQLFEELFRVVKVGGRIAISDIVSDEISPDKLKDNDYLWSGCISGALQETQFVKALESVGFYGIKIDKYEAQPWQIVEGIEYRSVTITAYKGKEGPCLETNDAVIYKGPWKAVEDDDGHVFERGERMAVCEKTFNIMTSGPYTNHMIAVPSQVKVSNPAPFPCGHMTKRSPAETKAGVPKTTTEHAKGGCC